MNLSFKHMKQVADELLAERIQFVQQLSELETETYDIVKDKLTGEHYLHYHYVQVNISGDGEKEIYHQLLPIDNDDVLTLLFEKPDYSYPDYWKHSYLRNGPNGYYVWFDPGYSEDYDESLQLIEDIKAKMNAFKKQGVFDQEAMKKLMNELDQLRKEKD